MEFSHRWAFVQALVEAGEYPRARGMLADMLKGPDVTYERRGNISVRMEELAGLERGQKLTAEAAAAIEPLKAALRDGSAGVCRNAAWALGQMGQAGKPAMDALIDLAVLKALAPMLTDPDAKVRNWARDYRKRLPAATRPAGGATGP